MRFSPDHWALVLGGSSGFGLAAARKLSQHGMNLFLVHRDLRGAMKTIEPEFVSLRREGVRVETHNVDALSGDRRLELAGALEDALGSRGKVRLLLHSIAAGNLKQLAPLPLDPGDGRDELKRELAGGLGCGEGDLQQLIDRLFAAGGWPLLHLATPPAPSPLLRDEDFAFTIYAMGTSLVSWVRTVFERGLFCDDARVLSLTSEGNSVAWRGYAAVSAAKAALEAVTRACAVEYASYGIRANVVQAGVTDTRALRMIPGAQHLKAAARLRNPFSRLTTPEDVANVIYLLCLDEAAWINGEVIRVDGGERIAAEGSRYR